MVEEWHAASQETKIVRARDGVQERAKTALMVAPTWAEIDALNTCARQKLRSTGRLTGEDQSFVSLRAKDWTKAQQKDHRSYQPGDILVAHKETKHFAKGRRIAGYPPGKASPCGHAQRAGSIRAPSSIGARLDRL
jgi:hypothetical protein